MAKKIIAIVLLVVGVLGIFILLTYGGAVFPHIVGPTAAVGGGVFVVVQEAGKVITR
ncbi:MAG: hypothetical protein HY869_03290 [Chloroflexi bacterium]|nr:hypothetical protein [Chloroflexota bacterium]